MIGCYKQKTQANLRDRSKTGMARPTVLMRGIRRIILTQRSLVAVAALVLLVATFSPRTIFGGEAKVDSSVSKSEEAIFFSLSNNRGDKNRASTSVLWTPSPQDFSTKSRSNQTIYDTFYQHQSTLILPKTKHALLKVLPNDDDNNNNNNVLVIGDVHGCLAELQRLLEAAVQENGGHHFRNVLLVGDVIHKGPQSVQVLRFIQKQQQKTNSTWWMVRGNHEERVLHLLLQRDGFDNMTDRDRQKYQWMFDDDNNRLLLTDYDIAWLSELPYTIRIPAWKKKKKNSETLIVHGGLVPGVALFQQSTETMTTIRQVEETKSPNKYVLHRDRHEPGGMPWATVWDGPPHVVFGHDTSRSLQLAHKATGLDTGAVYGRQLTGLILPEHKLVSVESARDYTKKQRKKNKNKAKGG